MTSPVAASISPIMTTALLSPQGYQSNILFTITGSGFTGTTSVVLNNATGADNLSFNVVSDTEIQFSYTNGSAYWWQYPNSNSVVVTTPGGTATVDIVIYAPLDGLTLSVSPTSASAGYTVQLSDPNDDGAMATVTTVYFGEVAVPVTGFQNNSGVVTVPVLSAYGPVEITVANPLGQSNGAAFAYLPSAGCGTFTVAQTATQVVAPGASGAVRNNGPYPVYIGAIDVTADVTERTCGVVLNVGDSLTVSATNGLLPGVYAIAQAGTSFVTYIEATL